MSGVTTNKPGLLCADGQPCAVVRHDLDDPPNAGRWLWRAVMEQTDGDCPSIFERRTLPTSAACFQRLSFRRWIDSLDTTNIRWRAGHARSLRGERNYRGRADSGNGGWLDLEAGRESGSEPPSGGERIAVPVRYLR